MKAELFDPVLDWLDAGAPETQGFAFNMGYFNHNPGCGTACCIAGAINQFNDLEVSEGRYHQNAIDEIRNLIGMTKKQAADLFYAGRTFDDGASRLPYDRYLQDVTPAGAAHAIRTFIATGKADWTRFDA